MPLWVFFQAKQIQLSKPLLIWEMLQSFSSLWRFVDKIGSLDLLVTHYNTVKDDVGFICWRIVILVPNRTPRPFSAKLLPSSSAPSMSWCVGSFLWSCKISYFHLLNLLYLWLWTVAVGGDGAVQLNGEEGSVWDMGMQAGILLFRTWVNQIT